MTEYLEKLNEQKNQELINELKEYAKINNVPIMEEDGILAVKLMIKLTNAKRILEIGTAIGYSSILMASELCVERIDTIERNKEMYDKAIENIFKANLNKKIYVHFNDALELDLKELLTEYDLILIDAAKAQYQKFFDKYTPLLKENGIVITDNILFHGCVENQTNLSKNVLHMVKKIDQYNCWLKENNNYQTTFLPLGDGQAISIKVTK